MKRIYQISGTILFIYIIVIGCDKRSDNDENVNRNLIETTDKQPTNDIQTVTAKYIEGYSLEGDADLTFEKEDGKKIQFYRNYTNPDEPSLKFDFISEEGLSANKKLVGQIFIIKYKVNPKGKLSMVSGQSEPCNQIVSVEQK